MLPRRWHTFKPLLAATWQWIAAVELTLAAGFLGGVLALVIFAELSEGMLEQESLWLDTAVLALLRSVNSAALDTAATAVSFLGFEAVLIFFVLLLVRFMWRGQWLLASQLFIVTLGSQLLNTVLKTVFERPRPEPVLFGWPGQVFSFPSGHAMGAAGFYLFVAWLAWRGLRGPPRLWVSGGLLLLIGLIGLSRLYLGVHYLTDVVAGYVAGFIWTDTVILAFHLAPYRHGLRRRFAYGSKRLRRAARWRTAARPAARVTADEEQVL